MKKEKITLHHTFLLALLAVLILVVVSCTPQEKNQSALAECLVEEGAIMAGTDWCPHCKEQKAAFGGAFEEILAPAGNYINCDTNKQWCDDNEVTGYPTWILTDGSHLRGKQDLGILARATGCTLD